MNPDAQSLEFPTYDSIGVRPLVNCKGTYTIISGSLMLPEEAARALADGEPRIEMFTHDSGVSVMPYMMEPGDDEVVARRLPEVLGSQ